MHAAIPHPAEAQRTLLSPCDVVFLGLHRTMWYVYRTGPDTALLKDKLRLLAKEIPDIAGTIGKCEDDNFYILRNDTGVEFSVEELAHSMPDYGVERLIDDGDANTDIRSYLKKHFNIDGPLVKFRMTRFACGGAILAMDLAHSLTDGVGRGLLLAHWARLCRGQASICSLDHNRSTLLKLAQGSGDAEDSEKWVQMPPSELLRRLDVDRNGPGVYAVVKASSTAITELRHQCDVLVSGFRISYQDVLMAKLWQMFANIQPVEPKARLCLILDFRRRPDLGVGPNYFGNAVTFARIDYDVAQTRSASIAALALQIRTRTDEALAFNKVASQQRSYWRHRHLREQGLVAIERQYLDTLGTPTLTINNLSRFPIRELDFGTGAPIWVGGLKQPGWPSVGIFPLSGPGEDGYALHLNLCERDMQQFLDLAGAAPFFGCGTPVKSRCVNSVEEHGVCVA